VSNQAGEDRQPGGVGRRPPVGPKRIAAEVEDRAGAGIPTVRVRIPGRTGRPGPVELVELAALEPEHEDVAVSGTVRTALDRWIVGNRIRAWIALARVLEHDGNERLRRGHYRVRESDRRAVPERPKVGMEV